MQTEMQPSGAGSTADVSEAESKLLLEFTEKGELLSHVHAREHRHLHGGGGIVNSCWCALEPAEAGLSKVWNTWRPLHLLRESTYQDCF